MGSEVGISGDVRMTDLKLVRNANFPMWLGPEKFVAVVGSPVLATVNNTPTFAVAKGDNIATVFPYTGIATIATITASIFLLCILKA